MELYEHLCDTKLSLMVHVAKPRLRRVSMRLSTCLQIRSPELSQSIKFKRAMFHRTAPFQILPYPTHLWCNYSRLIVYTVPNAQKINTIARTQYRASHIPFPHRAGALTSLERFSALPRGRPGEGG